MSRIIFSFVAALCLVSSSIALAQEVAIDYFESVPDQPFYAGTTTTSSPGLNLKFSTEFLVLDRDDSSSGTFLFDFVTGEELLPFENLSGSAQTGVRFGITAIEDGCHSTEFSYLQMDHFGSVQTVQSANLISFLFFGGFPATPEDEYSVHYTSVFQSFEVNRRKRFTPRIEGLIGFRYFDLNETFNIESDSGVFASGVDNDMYGLQVGGDILLWQFRHARLNTTLKTGIFYDNADVTAQAVNPANGLQMKFINDEDEVALAAEIKLGFWVPMGSRAALNIGYQGFYLDGIGLAPNQIDNVSIFTGIGNLDTSSVWFHGGYVGFEFVW